MAKLLRVTNKNRLNRFRDTYSVGNLTLTEEAKSLEMRRMQESSVLGNELEIKNVSNTITEFEFYVMYLTVISTANILTNRGDKLTPTYINYLAKFMSKPLDYTIPVNSKSNRISEIADELGKSSQSLYNAINKLKKHKWIYIDEDQNLKLQTKLENLRKIIKTQLEINDNVAIWDTLFRYVIKN